MKSYDDLQRFREKTQTNHIEFKDMSDQALKDGATNWAIIKQLVETPGEGTLENVQHVSRGAPQAISPDLFSRTEPAPAPAAPAASSIMNSMAAAPAAPTQRAASSILNSMTPAASAPVSRAAGGILDALASSSPRQNSVPDAPQAAPETAAIGTPAVLPASPSFQTVENKGALGAALLNAVAAKLPGSDAPASSTLLNSVAQPVAPAAGASLLQTIPAAATSSTDVAPSANFAEPAATAGRFRQLFSAQDSQSAPGVDAKQTLLQPLLEKIASCR